MPEGADGAFAPVDDEIDAVGASDVEWDPDCQPPARVFVEEQRIPIINDGVEVEFRKQGPLDLQSIADVYFPAEDQYGQDWMGFVSENLFNLCQIEVYDQSTGEYHLTFRGIIQGIGSGNTTRNEMRIHAIDPALVLKEIPASKEFEGANIRDVLRYVSTEVSETFEGIISVGPDIRTSVGTSIVGPDGQTSVTDPQIRTGTEGTFTQLNDTYQASYSPNRHTLQDVVSDLSKKVASLIYFDPVDGLEDTYRLVQEGIDVRDRFEAQSVGGDVAMLENNMLAEINPVNAIEYKGQKVTSEKGGQQGDVFEETVTDLLEWGNALDVPKKTEFPSVLVQHTPTKEIAGKRVAATATGDEKSLEEAISSAKHILKEKLDTAGYGNAVSLVNPRLRPYDILHAPLRCEDSARPFRYEIERVAHQVGANGQYTEFECSFAVKREEIDVVDEETGYVDIEKQ